MYSDLYFKLEWFQSYRCLWWTTFTKKLDAAFSILNFFSSRALETFNLVI
ncbi:uncharacterized protein DS421_5g147970 [Arachis hypogaea]|nr:uncharacterized protein DS421_5g147970 [Arachis hypogaea]